MLKILRIVKTIYFNTPLLWKYFLPVMKFDMNIEQLNFIWTEIKNLTIPGDVLEVGVGGGSTSVMINLHLRNNSIKRKFYAIDTFYGFTEEDIRYEQDKRSKNDNYLYYRSNSKAWYEKTLNAHGIHDASVFKSDAKLFDYSQIKPLAFVLFDVDLYLPTKEVLPKLYEALQPGGVIVVDDCSAEKSIYDGAGQAYREFCHSMGMPEEIVFIKLGVIRKT